MNEKIVSILEHYRDDINRVVRRNKISLWLMIAAVIVFFIGDGILIYVAASIDVASAIMIVFPCLLVAFVVALGLTGIILQRRTRKSFGQNEFIQQDGDVIIALYETFLEEMHKTTSIVKTDLFKDKKIMVSSFTFKNGLFNYVFTTRTWKEVHGSSGSSNIVYFVEYTFGKKPLDTIDDGTFIATLTTDTVLDHKSGFESESIAFNKMFNVNGTDILAITKFFEPKLIDELVNIGIDSFEKLPIKIYENCTEISYREKVSGWNPHYALSDFNMMKYSVGAVVAGIVEKIKNDMNIFMKLRGILAPFDFGEE